MGALVVLRGASPLLTLQRAQASLTMPALLVKSATMRLDAFHDLLNDLLLSSFKQRVRCATRGLCIPWCWRSCGCAHA